MGFLVVINVLFMAITVNSYLYVVPQESCIDMMPRHDAWAPQSPPPPYSIFTERPYYDSYDRIRVTLQGVGSRFLGFLLQARLIGTNHIVGTWSYNEIQNPNIGVIRCQESNNSLTHAWASFSNHDVDFFTNVSVFWIAPLANNWDVEFIATVVLNKQTFWTNIKSTPLVPRARFRNNGNRNTPQCAIFATFFIIIIILHKL